MNIEKDIAERFILTLLSTDENMSNITKCFSTFYGGERIYKKDIISTAELLKSTGYIHYYNKNGTMRIILTKRGEKIKNDLIKKGKEYGLHNLSRTMS